MTATRLLSVTAVLALATAPVLALAPWRGEPRYTIERLGSVSVLSLNDSGWILGTEGERGSKRAFVLVEGRRRWLDELGVDASVLKISEDGTVAGAAADSSRRRYACLWRDGRVTRLGSPAGVLSAGAGDVNARGEAVGGANVYQRYPIALLWRGGAAHVLPPLAPDSFADTQAINDAGWIAGQAKTATGESHAVLWRDGRPLDLGTLGGPRSYSTDINERGQVVGMANAADHHPHAFLWEDGRMTDLNPPGTRSSAAEAMNDSGQVVGWVSNGEGTSRSVLWDRGRLMYLDQLVDLEAAGWLRLLGVMDINNRGWIIGAGRRRDGTLEAWVMKPVR